MRRVLLAVPLALCACSGESFETDRGGDWRVSFEREVVPVLEESCGNAACHGADEERLATLDESYFAFPVDAEGRVRDARAVTLAYERALHTLSPDGARFADLVRKPLDEALGGLPHRGGTQFRAEDDPALDALRRWAEMATPADDEPLPPLVQRYADTVQPVLMQKGCMLTNCHGGGASNSLVLDAGVLGEIDRAATLRNYRKVVFHLNLDTPDPMMARIVRKTIPQEHGGIFHRGGNAFFDPTGADEALSALTDFMAEARSRTGAEGTGVVTGLVFAATDPTPRALFDVGAWQPGGDVWSLVPAEPGGTLTNLTARHHTGPADVRDPAVSHDGTRVAFAMRTSPDDCLNLYVMNLDGTDLAQLTHDRGPLPNGIRPSNVEPLWGPDDRIYFTSTRAGVLADGGRFPRANIWRIDDDGSGLVQITYSADHEIAPAWRPYHVAGREPEDRTLDLMLTAVRGVGDERHAPIMRVPPDFRADYHPHFGTQDPVHQVFTQISVFPDDRDVLVLMDEDNLWEGGALALIDRNLGPTISDGGEPAVVGYVDNMTVLEGAGEEVRHRGSSRDGYYRDPHAMPDGTIVASRFRGTIDHCDPETGPDTSLVRIHLRDREGNRVELEREETLVDLPGKVETDPAPVMVRRREEILDASEHLDLDRPSGDLLNFDLAVDLVVARENSPSRTKDFDETAAHIHWVRIVEQVPLTPADFPDWPDTSRHRIGRGSHGMRRVLAEIPATADRSYWVELPATVPFYVQALDFDRTPYATHNLWVFLLPGEHLRNVTRREVFDHRCGACHGARSGDPADTVGAPDAITQASIVAANVDPVSGVALSPTRGAIEPAERIEVDFERDVQPIFDGRCATVSCHGPGEALDLSRRGGFDGFSGSYEALTAPGSASANGFAYVDPESANARTSYLAEVITGSELDAPRSLGSPACPAADRLSLAQVETLFRWMDLGASYRGIGPREPPVLPEL